MDQENTGVFFKFFLNLEISKLISLPLQMIL